VTRAHLLFFSSASQDFIHIMAQAQKMYLEEAIQRGLSDDYYFQAMGAEGWITVYNNMLVEYEKVQPDQNEFHAYSAAVARRYSWLCNKYPIELPEDEGVEEAWRMVIHRR
jgi:hypothetical protein